MVAEDRVVTVLLSSWRMAETCPKAVEVSDWLEANAMIWIDLSDFL
jgi:hypothetical protein